jgi:hypothetical protein
VDHYFRKSLVLKELWKRAEDKLSSDPVKGTRTMTMAATSPAAASRAEINRRNAARCTGPRTAAGTQKVKFNALRHGLRAGTAVLPGEEETLRARRDAWTISLDPRDEVERFLVGRAVAVSL